MAKDIGIRINRFKDLQLLKNNNHNNLFYKDIASVGDMEEMGIGLRRVMHETLLPGGQVLPHTHKIAEIIYLVAGNAEVLVYDEWIRLHEGDTIIVKANTVHSVRNVSETDNSEQISIFVPMKEEN